MDYNPIPDENTKMLTDAQARHYQMLAMIKDQALNEMQRFANYLALEHGISGDGWTLEADRFIRREE